MSVPKKASLLLAATVVIISIIDADWMWLGVALIGIAITLYPRRDEDFNYSPLLLWSASILLLIQIVLGGLIYFEIHIKLLWVLSLVIQTCICTVYGYMLALLLNEYTSIKLSERWILVFSLLFAMAVSGVYLFYQFVYLYTAGYPVFNHQIQGILPSSERIWINLQMMYPPTIATFVSIGAVLILRHWTKHNNLSCIKRDRHE